MLEEVIEELRAQAEKAQTALKRDLSKLRTGRASAGMLEGIRVEYYGQMSAISQVASVAVPEPRMLTVKPWEKTLVKALERALRESDLGLNPQVDGDTIRVPIPPLTEERRRDLVKLAKKSGEDCRIAVRKARHEANDTLAALKKEGEASEDEVERAKKKVEEAVGEAVAAVEGIIRAKEKEILAI